MIPWQVGWVMAKGFFSKHWKMLLIMAAAAVAAVTIRSMIYNSAYSDAMEDFQKRMDAAEEVWTKQLNTKLTKRDEYWTAQVAEEQERVLRILSQNSKVRQEQRQLREQLATTAAELVAVRQEYENANLGTAAFTNDADRLLFTAYSTAFGRQDNPPGTDPD